MTNKRMRVVLEREFGMGDSMHVVLVLPSQPWRPKLRRELG
jgi:hypothetical protein